MSNENLENLIFDDLSLEKIEKTENQKRELFKLLKKRSSIDKISATTSISYETHSKFVDNNEYRYWFLIKNREEYVGTFYLTEMNGIGVFLVDNSIHLLEKIFFLIPKTFKPLPEIPSIRLCRFHVNIAIDNTKYSNILEKLGAELVQKSYLLK